MYTFFSYTEVFFSVQKSTFHLKTQNCYDNLEPVYYLSEYLQHYDDVFTTRVEDLSHDLVLRDHVVLTTHT